MSPLIRFIMPFKQHLSFKPNMLWLAIIPMMMGCPGNQEKKSEAHPNIVLIFIDDFGWPAISCYGNEHVSTPNIDRIANEGMKFTDAYVTPQCTPSRASLMTGQHTARLRMWHVTGRYGYPYARMKEPPYRENMPHESYTIAEALRDNGYETALLGKWHLSTWGKRYPLADGYYTTLFQEGKDEYGFNYVDIAKDVNYHQKTDKGVDYLTDEAISFMKQNQDNPFFLYLSHHTIHGPILAPEYLIQKYREKGYPEEGQFNATYLAAIEHMDNSVGRLLDEMENMGLAENTVVMFLTDNGGVEEFFSNAPLRDGKGSTYEGGIRVPFMVRWPGKIAANTVSDLPVHVNDMYPTILDLAGVEVKEEVILDGISVFSELTGEKIPRNRDLFWYMPLYDWQWGATPAAVIRSGDFKLIKSFGDYYDHHHDEYFPEPRLELFNLKDDIGETQNLVESQPEKARELETKLMHWITEEMRAPLPTTNPDYDHSRIFDRSNDFNFELFFEAPLSDIQVHVNQDFKYIIPRNAVADYDDEGYTLKARMADQSSWPDWLFFNKFERTLLGKPSESGEWGILLTAKDPHGSEVSQEITLLVE